MSRPTCGSIMRATGDELLWLRDHRCSTHGHRYLSHFNCFLKDEGISEKIALLDIEASHLKGNLGVMLSWVIRDFGTDIIYYDCLTLHDINSGIKDKRIVSTLVDVLKGFDRIVCHYIKFDVAFVRTRALIDKIPFLPQGSCYISDTWRMAKDKLALYSNRQDVVAEAIQGNDVKTRIHPGIWINAQFGTAQERKDALVYVLDHNLKDVEQLLGNYSILRKYYHETRTQL